MRFFTQPAKNTEKLFPKLEYFSSFRQTIPANYQIQEVL